jgi:predicted alpha/beta hydrolase family esterase
MDKKPVLLVQGAGEGAYDEDARLAASLRTQLGPGYEVRYPRMPDEGSPDEAAWKRRMEEELRDMGRDPLLVGHSIGAGILVELLAEQRPERGLGGIFLVAAPFMGGEGWQIEGAEPSEELLRRLPREVPTFLYHGTLDEIVPFAHLELYARALPQATVRRLVGRNHQLGDDLSEVAADIRATSC